jgi:hypothetical protein
VGFEDWTSQWVQAFIDLSKWSWLQNDIRVGLVKAKKNTSRGSTDETIRSVGVVFVVHEDDEQQQICIQCHSGVRMVLML